MYQSQHNVEVYGETVAFTLSAEQANIKPLWKTNKIFQFITSAVKFTAKFSAAGWFGFEPS